MFTSTHRRIDFQEQTARPGSAFHQRRVIAFQQSEIKAAILHRAAVNEEVLLIARGAGDTRFADEAPQSKVDGEGGTSR